MSSHREQQQEEIDLLQNIIFEKMKIVQEEPNYIIFMEIKSEIEKAKMKFHLTVTLNDEYPDKEPTFELAEVNNYLASVKVRELEEKINSLCKEYISMPMLYQMYESILSDILSFADEEEEKLLNSRTYTPVTKELFDEWYKKFIDKKKKERREKEPNMDKLTGRQFFMNKNLKIEENNEDIKKDEDEDKKNEDNKEEENVEYNPELYEEDIDNIDFDKDDIDIDKI